MNNQTPPRRPQGDHSEWKAGSSRWLCRALLGCLLLSGATSALAADLNATWNSVTDVPLTTGSYDAAGKSIALDLQFAPSPGTTLTVIRNTGVPFITGQFTDLAQGQNVDLVFGGRTYQFIANYFGGSGNDLVLLWRSSRAFAWGSNVNGQLGHGSTTNSSVPVAVTASGVLAGKTIVATANGSAHSLALCADGTLAAWGANSNGQLGDNTLVQRSSPVSVSTSGVLSGKTVVAIAAGYAHSLALCSDGTVAAWGANFNGQLGDNTQTQRMVPVLVNTATGVSALDGKSVVAIAAGLYHSVALCSDGTVVSWGDNFSGQLGDSSTTQHLAPVAVDTSTELAGKTVVRIAAGYMHTLALCSDGSLAAWGANAYGQLGNNSTSDSPVPVAVLNSGVLAGRTISGIAAGYGHSLAFCSDGATAVAAWGANFSGQLGNNSNIASSVPVLVSAAGISALNGKTVAAIASGSGHGLALCTDGTAAAWGANDAGQLGETTTTARAVPFAVNSGAGIGGAERFAGVFGGANGNHSLAIVAGPPEIVVEQPSGTNLTDGGLVTFETVTLGHSSLAKTFTIRNSGTANLAGLSLSVGGSNPLEFSVGSLGATTLAPGASTTFQVTFTPGSIGVKSMEIDIFSNDTDEYPFDITLQGQGADLHSSWASLADIPNTASSYDASGKAATLSLEFDPPTGANLTVIRNTGPAFINGTFTNIPQGGTVPLVYNGKTYHFVANYFGGSGNDLVLVWKGSRPYGWGTNASRQLGDNTSIQRTSPVPVTGVLAGKTVISTAVGAGHSLALCSDGTVAAWGLNANGQLGNGTTMPTSVPVAVTLTGALVNKTVRAIAVGANHSLALCTDNTSGAYSVVAWGANASGQLGDNSTTQRLQAVAVTASGVLTGKTVVAIAAGSDHSLALCSDGTVAAWGANAAGQLGNSSNTQSNVPVLVTATGVLNGKSVKAISAGATHSLALCTDNTLAAWGANVSGQLGNGNNVNSNAPVLVSVAGVLSGKTISAIAAGGDHCLALCTDNTTFAVSLTAWGRNANGELGDDSTTSSNVPVAVSIAATSALAYKTVTSIAAGSSHSLALCSDGTLTAWGLNAAGQLGDDSVVQRTLPVAVATSSLGGRTVTSVAAGLAHNLVLCSDGSLAAWGENSSGQLGDNSTTQRNQPASVVTYDVLYGKTVIATATGYAHTLALCSDGTLAAWGGNAYGQLGNNSSVDSPVPVVVNQFGFLAGKTVRAIAAGHGHSLALCSDGTIASWGTNGNGQLGTGNTTASTVPVQVVATGVLNGKTVVGVAAGYLHSLALCSDGTVASWGFNGTGQLGDNSTTQRTSPVLVNTASGTSALNGKTVVSVGAGSHHSLALCQDGTMAAWGANFVGQLGDNTTTQQLVPVAVNAADGVSALFGRTADSIAAGFYHNLALCSDGTIVSWGANGYGQLGDNSVVQSNAPVAVISSVGELSERFVYLADTGNHLVRRVSTSGVVSSVAGTPGVSGTADGFGSAASFNGPKSVAYSSSRSLLFVADAGNHAIRSIDVRTGEVKTVAGLPGTSGSATGAGASARFFNPTAIAIDAAEANLYVADTNNHAIRRIDIGDINAPVVSTVAGSASSSAVEGVGPGTANGAGSASRFRNPRGVLVDSSGNLYVADSGNHTIRLISDPNGSPTVTTPLGSALAAGSANGNGTSARFNSPVGLSLNAAGSVMYVADQGNHVIRAVALSTLAVTTPVGSAGIAGGADGVGSVARFSSPEGVGADDTGNLFVTDTGNHTTRKVVLTSNTVSTLAGAVGVTGSLDGVGGQFSSPAGMAVAPDTKTVLAVSSGYAHSMALCMDGTGALSVASWGSNLYGQLGDATVTTRVFPVPVNRGALGADENFGTVTSGSISFHSFSTVGGGAEVSVEQPLGTQLVDGSASALDFGSVQISTPSTSKVFTIRNNGGGDLTGLVVSKDGTHANDFTVGSLGVTSLPAGASTTFSVTFTPSAAGTRTAAIHLASGDSDEASFDISLTGTGTGNQFREFTSLVDSPITVPSLDASGTELTLKLSFQPDPGTTLTAINVTDPAFIAGRFTNLAQGQLVGLEYNGRVYHFIANYYGGTGNDLVLQWKDVRAYGWGRNANGQLGDNSTTARNAPVAVTLSTGFLYGKTVSSMSAGSLHSVALCSDGTVAAWGLNSSGQVGDASNTQRNVAVGVVTTTGALSGKTVVATASGNAHNLALCSDGTLATWGDNSRGQLGNNTTNSTSTPVAVNSFGDLSGRTVIAVGAGYNHSLAVCSDGALVAWGDNTNGQLGLGTTTQRNQGVRVAGLLGNRVVIAAAGGNGHTLALCSDGSLFAWGLNSSGQVGDGSNTNRTIPVAVNVNSGASALFGKTVAQIAAGGTHSLARCSDGTVAAWGANANGQLGNNTTTASNLAVQVINTAGSALLNRTVISIAAGDLHSLALCSDGTAASWGDNAKGQLGDNSTTQRLLPVQVNATSGSALNNRTAVAIASGNNHGLALRSDGTLASWGDNTNGQLGDNSTTQRNRPVNVTISPATSALAGRTILSTATGDSFTLALCSDGAVVSWGLNSSGQLGDNSTTQRNTAVLVNTTPGSALAGKFVVAVAAGFAHALALCDDGTVVSWGLNDYGQLGDNSITNRSRPVLVNALEGSALYGKSVVAIAAGGAHSLALCSDGTVAAWGGNFDGQLGDLTLTQRNIPVAVNTTQVLSVLYNKTVVGIAAGNLHSLALCSDGVLASWGMNVNGQLGNNTTTSSSAPVQVVTSGALNGRTVKALAAGSTHNLALCTDGRIVAWGNNGSGRLGDNSTTQRNAPVLVVNTGALGGKTVTAITAGSEHSVAVCSDGTAASWGRNDNNSQLGDGTGTNRSAPVLVAAGAVGSDRHSSLPVGPVANHTLTTGGGSSPEISVEEPQGTLLADLGTVSFGELGGGAGVTKTFTVTNTGAGNLTGLSVTRDGSAALDYTIERFKSSSWQTPSNTNGWWTAGAILVPGASATFDVVFRPNNTGVRTAALHILSNDSDESGFDLTLSGNSSTALAASWSNTASVPLTVSSFNANGKTVTFNPLPFEPLPATILTLVRVTGSNFITGRFSNLAQGATVTLAYGGRIFEFVAHYYGGTGNDLVLIWKGSRALSWGDNGNGQLGINNTTTSDVPVAVNVSNGTSSLYNKTVVATASGNGHSLAICIDHNSGATTLVGWGRNSNGQVGDNSTTQRQVPVNVTGGALSGKTVVAIAAGSAHSLALCSDGTLAAWGLNTNGQLGDNSTSQRQSPVTVNTTAGLSALAGKSVVAIAAGGNHSLALCSDGSVCAWGRNDYDQLGDNSGSQRTVPVLVTSGALAFKSVIGLAAGASHSMALCLDNRVEPPVPSVATWGRNEQGQLGERFAYQADTANHVIRRISSTSPSVVSLLAGTPGTSGTTNGFRSGASFNAPRSVVYDTKTGGSHRYLLFVADSGNHAIRSIDVRSGQVRTVAGLPGTSGSALGAGTAARFFNPTSIAIDAAGNNLYVTDTNNHAVRRINISNIDAPVVSAVAGSGSPDDADAELESGSTDGAGSAALFKFPQGVVVDAAGDLYVADTNNHTIRKITNPAGSPTVSTPLGSAGAAGSTNATGTAARFNSPVGLAVGVGGAALYVADRGNHTIRAIALPGLVVSTPVGSAGNAGEADGVGNAALFRSPEGVGVDDSGLNLYVGDTGNHTARKVVILSNTVTTMAGTPGAPGSVNGAGGLAQFSSPSGLALESGFAGASALAGKTPERIASGSDHCLVRCSDGSVVAWGRNEYGQLGDNSTTHRNLPVLVNADNGVSALYNKTVRSLFAGNDHSGALCSDNTTGVISVVSWGRDNSGQLGDNAASASRLVAVASYVDPVVIGTDIYTAVTSGCTGNHTFLLTGGAPDIDVVLSNTSRADGGSAISLGTVFVGASVQNTFTVRNLGSSGTVSGLSIVQDGANVADFQVSNLGTTTLPPGASTTFTVNFAPLSEGTRTTALHILNNDTKYSVSDTNENPYDISLTGVGTRTVTANWSSATSVPMTFGRSDVSGNIINMTLSYAPEPGTMLTAIRTTGSSAIAGRYTNLAHGQSVALTFNSVVYHFVANYYGGNGNDLVLVWKGTSPFGWGANAFGQVGDNTTVQRNAPTSVNLTGPLAGKTVFAAMPGGGHTLAIACADNSSGPGSISLVAWGDNTYGQLGDGTTTQRNAATEVDTSSASALYGKIVVAVAAGRFHSLALCSDGSVAAWGDNASGQLGDGTTTSQSVPVLVNALPGSALYGRLVVSIAAGAAHSLALCSDGTVVAWGSNSNGQLGDNSTTNRLLPVEVNATSSSALFNRTVLALAGGSLHSLALCSDNTVAAWGSNSNGQLGDNSTTQRLLPVAVNNAQNVSTLYNRTVNSIAAGTTHSLALCSDNTIGAWGSNSFGELGDNSLTQRLVPVTVVNSRVLSGKGIAFVAAGESHSMATCTDGSAAAWGRNDSGQVGDNTVVTPRDEPVLVNRSAMATGVRFMVLSSGPVSQHSIALVGGPRPEIEVELDGTALTDQVSSLDFGTGLVGAAVSPRTFTIRNIGTGDLTGISVPSVGDFLVTNLGATTLLEGESTTFEVNFKAGGVGARGAILQIASNDTDENPFDLTFTGTGTSSLSATWTSSSDIPLTVTSVNPTGDSISFSLGYAPSPGTTLTVIRNTGPAFFGGVFTNLPQGQLVPLTFGGNTYDFVANYYGGDGNDLVLIWKGARAFAAGSNTNGQLGDNSTTARQFLFPAITSGVLSGKTVVALATGGNHSLALSSNGVLAAWGDNASGQLGDTTTTQRTSPQQVNATSGSGIFGKTVVAVAAGKSHSLALCSDGTVSSWGDNAKGQLGLGDTSNRLRPVAVTGGALAGKSVVAVAAGNAHSLALCSDGTVAAWGENTNGQLGDNTTTQRLTPVLVNSFSGSAIYGKIVVAVAAGSAHSLALCSDGTGAAWGLNSSGQLGDGSTTQRNLPVVVYNLPGSSLYNRSAVSIAAGGAHSFALCSDGTIACWGSNSNGQLGDGSTTQRILPISVNATSVSALDGKTVVSLGAGELHSYAVCLDGSLVVWGDNSKGQLGDNSTAQRTLPVLVSRASLSSGERFMVASKGALGNHTLASVGGPAGLAEIVIEQPAGMSLTDGDTTPISFGGSGSSNAFFIRNGGTANLTGLTFTKDGTHASEFTVLPVPTAPVAGGGSTGFTVTFSPAASGTRTAALHFTSNDADETVFDIQLSGNSSGASTKAEMVTPAPGSALAAATQTFTWNAGSSPTGYWLYVGSSVGAKNYHDSGKLATSTLSRAVSGLPTNGSRLYVRLFTQVAGSWIYNDYTYTASSGTRAEMLTPVHNSTLNPGSVAFTWKAGNGASSYWLYVGSSQGASNYYNSGALTSSVLAKTVSGSSLPTDGSTVYARLFSYVGNTWIYNDYFYTASTGSGGGNTKAVMTTPTPSTTLGGSTVNFVWSAGTGATAYWLYAGSSVGAKNYHDSNVLGSGVLNRSVSGLPSSGGTVYVRLWTQLSGSWVYNDYTYTGYSSGGGSGTKAVMSSPVNGASLPGATASFTWNPGTNAQAYWLYAGSSAGASNYHSSGNLASSVLSWPVTGLPTNGKPVYVRLYTKLNNVWSYNDYTYSTGKAVMTSPVNSATINGTTATFTWSAAPGAPTAYWLYVGSTQGAKNYYDSGSLGTGVLSRSVTTLPANNSTVYVRLFTQVASGWIYNDYSYQSAP